MDLWGQSEILQSRRWRMPTVIAATYVSTVSGRLYVNLGGTAEVISFCPINGMKAVFLIENWKWKIENFGREDMFV